jgi:hypothetical protein
MKTPLAAPRLSASNPSAPVPANISNTDAPSRPLKASTLNKLSLVLSNVGLVSLPLGDFNTLPLALPDIILTLSPTRT